MKQKYLSPELDITKLTTEDILSDSPEVDNEIFIDSEDLWG